MNLPSSETLSAPFVWATVLAATAGAIPWAVNRGLLEHAGRLLTTDTPNERLLHRAPTPRGGGLGICAALFVLAAPTLAVLGEQATLATLFVPLAATVAVSYWDDHRSLAPLPRLLVHIGAALWLVLGAGALDAVTLPGVRLTLGPVLGGVFTVLLVVWLTNLYNFMDGMDGFAGGMTAIGFAALGFLSGRGGDPAGLLIAWTAAGAGAGFLVLNFPPARLFMGDVGSLLLGFLAGALVVRAEQRAGVPLWAGLLIFAPFVLDASVTLVRRALRAERIWQAHRTHYYQRVVQLGWGHRRTVLVEYVLMLGCAISAIVALGFSPWGQRLVLLGWAVGFVLLMVGVGRAERSARGAFSGEGN